MKVEGIIPGARSMTAQLRIPLGLILLTSTLCSFFRAVDLLFFLGGAIFLLAYIISLFVRVALNLRRNNRRKTSLMLSGFALTVVLAWPTMMAGDYVHLVLMLPFYAPKLISAVGDEASFNWGIDGFVGASTEYILVYDRSGRREMAPASNSSSNGGQYSVGSRRLIGRFYLRTVFYP